MCSSISLFCVDSCVCSYYFIFPVYQIHQEIQPVSLEKLVNTSLSNPSKKRKPTLVLGCDYG